MSDDFVETETENAEIKETNIQMDNQNQNNFIPMNDYQTQMNSDMNQMNEFNNPILDNNLNMMDMNTNILDEEEQKRIEERQKEENERRNKIKEKMEFELKKKEELRQKAVEFLNDFENKRLEEIEKRKAENIKKENEILENKKLAKEGKINPWESITEIIAMKDSEYKGSKEVKRMREVIINRKNDIKEGNDKN